MLKIEVINCYFCGIKQYALFHLLLIDIMNEIKTPRNAGTIVADSIKSIGEIIFHVVGLSFMSILWVVFKFVSFSLPKSYYC